MNSRLGLIIKFEDMNPDYPDTQANGIFMETEKSQTDGFCDNSYLAEKVDNIIRFYTETLENFKHRIQDPEIRKEFCEFVKKKLD